MEEEPIYQENFEVYFAWSIWDRPYVNNNKRSGVISYLNVTIFEWL